jgi:hypothetical protein
MELLKLKKFLVLFNLIELIFIISFKIYCYSSSIKKNINNVFIYPLKFYLKNVSVCVQNIYSRNYIFK